MLVLLAIDGEVVEIVLTDACSLLTNEPETIAPEPSAPEVSAPVIFWRIHVAFIEEAGVITSVPDAPAPMARNRNIVARSVPELSTMTSVPTCVHVRPRPVTEGGTGWVEPDATYRWTVSRSRSSVAEVTDAVVWLVAAEAPPLVSVVGVDRATSHLRIIKESR
jgi:hypothetical protein